MSRKIDLLKVGRMAMDMAIYCLLSIEAPSSFGVQLHNFYISPLTDVATESWICELGHLAAAQGHHYRHGGSVPPRDYYLT